MTLREQGTPMPDIELDPQDLSRLEPTLVPGPLEPFQDPLAAEARPYLLAAKAGSTVRAYGFDWRHFLAWCEGRGAQALPAKPGTFALYLVTLAGTHRPATITRRLTSIAKAHGAAGYRSPANMREPVVAETL